MIAFTQVHGKSRRRTGSGRVARGRREGFREGGQATAPQKQLVRAAKASYHSQPGSPGTTGKVAEWLNVPDSKSGMRL